MPPAPSPTLHTYDAFGNLISRRTGATPNHYLYAASSSIPTLNLYFLRALSDVRNWTFLDDGRFRWETSRTEILHR